MLRYLIFLFSCFYLTNGLSQDKSGVSPQVIALPTGAGSIEGYGESFSPLINTGTANLTFNFKISPAINQFAPSFILSYNSGYGNGSYGIGWKLNTVFIQRQTDKGVPIYDETDRFIFSNGEELIRVRRDYYRFKNEELFKKFEFKDNYWIITDKDGTKHILGKEQNSKIINSGGIFCWMLEKSIDTNGNEIRYFYMKDKGQIYCKEVNYNIINNQSFSKILFDYENRSDSFTDYRSRYKVETAKRCTSINVVTQGKLVYRYQFQYQKDNKFSRLSSITKFGKDNSTYFPPINFKYNDFKIDSLEVTIMQNSPSRSLGNTNVELIDLNGDALPDLLYGRKMDHRFFVNEGNGNWKSKEERMVVPETLELKSPDVELKNKNVLFADCNSDGYADLLKKTSISSTGKFEYFPSKGRNFWEEGVFFSNNPDFDLSSDNLRMIDINNDKIIDALLTVGRNEFRYWINQENSWSESTLKDGIPNESIKFSNKWVKLADMNGDRMLDLVLISRSSVRFFANKGYGTFSSGISMSNSPSLSRNQRNNIKLTDINKDGISDLVLVESGIVRVWINSGNGEWANEIKITNGIPILGNNVQVRIADINANGTNDIIWNYQLRDGSERYEYLDFNSEHGIPNLLIEMDNGLGKVLKIKYKAVIKDYLADKERGIEWEKILPFPVTVISSTIIKDKNSGNEYKTEYFYKNGYYDGIEKEFRGFENVRKIEYGDQSAPTTITEYQFLTGEKEESLKGKTKVTTIKSEDGDIFNQVEQIYDTRNIYKTHNKETVTFPFIKAINTAIFESTDTPKKLLDSLKFDDYGNQIERKSFGVIEGSNFSIEDDELFSFSEYAIDTTKWILDRVKRIYETDEIGNFVREEKYYYDGLEYEGLPFGQLEKGNLTRLEANLGELMDNRWIQKQRYKRDAYGNIIGMKDGNGNLREIEYDYGFPVLPTTEIIYTNSPEYPEISGDALKTSVEYDYGFGVITKHTDFNKNITNYKYDSLGRISKIIKPFDSEIYPTISYEYSLNDPISSILTEERLVSGEKKTTKKITYFDGLGRSIYSKQQAENGQFILSGGTVYNSRMSKKTVLNPYFTNSISFETLDISKHKVRFKYDPLGRVIQFTNQDSSYSTTKFLPLKEIRFDEEDNTFSSSHFNTPTTYTYDGRYRLRVIEEQNKVNGELERYRTKYKYNLLDSLSFIEDNEGNVTSIFYDALGRQVQRIDPDRGLMKFNYDDANNLRWTADARKKVIVRRFDGANRVKFEGESTSERIQESILDYDKKVTYYYDNQLTKPYHSVNDNTIGRLAAIEDQAGLQIFKYDQRGNEIFYLRKIAATITSNGKIYDNLEFSFLAAI